MRRKLSISMPPAVVEFMYSRVRHGGYGSISEYVRELVRLDERFEILRANQPGRLDDLRRIVGPAGRRY